MEYGWTHFIKYIKRFVCLGQPTCPCTGQYVLTRYPCIHVANVIGSGSTLYLKMLGDLKYG